MVFYGDTEQPFILHNVDVISTIDLGRMMNFILIIRRSRHWRCRIGRLRDICCSTSRVSFAAGSLDAMGKLKWCVLQLKRRLWLSPAFMLFLPVCLER